MLLLDFNQWKCTLLYENGLAPSKMKFQACQWVITVYGASLLEEAHMSLLKKCIVVIICVRVSVSVYIEPYVQLPLDSIAL